MIDVPTQAVLLNIVRRAKCSLLQYVHDSFPWITPDEQDALAELKKLICAEREATAGIVRLLQRHHVTVPPYGTYPASFTTINYVSLAHLLPLLAQHEHRDVAELQASLPRASDAEVHTAVQQLLEMKQQHVKRLEQLAAAHPEPAMG